MSYLVYDLETTGLSPVHDVPLQAAFIQADADLTIQREITLRCRLPNHVVPSPDAMTVTGITPTMLQEQDLSHLEMMAQIGRIIADAKPCLVLGYNILRYDEEVLRQNFFQTLLPPYLTSLTGHGRADVYRMLQAVALFEPDAVVIPKGSDGKPSMKLGDVCRSNGIALSEDEAHDAVSDVRATLALFKLLLEGAPSIMATMLSHAKKSGPLGLIDSGQPLVLANGSRCLPVLPMVASPVNPAAWAAIDLNRDPGEYIDLAAPDLLALIRSNRSPVRSIRTNAQPILMAWDQGHHALGERPPDAIYHDRVRSLWAHPTFTRQVVLALQSQYADREPSPWVEERLYEEGFITDGDAAASVRWHQLPWSERAGHAARHIRDPRLRTLAIRQCYLHDPLSLSADARSRGDAWLRHRLMTEDEVPWTTFPKAVARCDEMLSDPTRSDDRSLMLTIRDWLAEKRMALGPEPNRGEEADAA